MSTPPRAALSLGIAIGTTQWVLRLNEELLISSVRPCIRPHQIGVCIRMPSGGLIRRSVQHQNDPVIQRRVQIKLHQPKKKQTRLNKKIMLTLISALVRL